MNIAIDFIIHVIKKLYSMIAGNTVTGLSTQFPSNNSENIEY